jgi:hypothetical protein
MSPSVDRRELSAPSFSISQSMALRALNDLDQGAACSSCERFKARVEALEKRVEELNQQLMAATAEANLYKGQCLVFERLCMGSMKKS